MMIASAAAPGKIPTRAHDQSLWRNFLDAVLESRTFNVEHEVIDYLYYQRHDLPPEVWIELERCRLDNDILKLARFLGPLHGLALSNRSRPGCHSSSRSECTSRRTDSM